MTRFELAVKVLVDDYKKEINDYYSDWEIESWSELLNAFGQSSADAKEDVMYILMRHENETGEKVALNDLGELEEEDGNIISYRKLMNAVRKQLF